MLYLSWVFFDSLTPFRLAALFYAEGDVLTDVVWRETIQELEFANVEKIITAM